ncbi:MAG: glycosyltransferase family 39 protein [Anaerolineae bacterium]|nr:glycosyltransferase family 39 protein [Anaerolineae bacterium]MDW8071852.1 glycosyltransferase family 39 protein [Anaerolineae bacterium]
MASTTDNPSRHPQYIPEAAEAASVAHALVRRLDAGLLVALLLTLFAIWPLLSHRGLPNTADGAVHLMRQAELNQAWQDGIPYPRWAPDLAYGYGMPLFHYAPPLLYHVTQWLHMAGLPLDEAMKGTLVLMVLLYSVGSYLFGRDLFGPRAGMLTAALYLYTPYRLRELYIQGNYGQFCGLAFYPLILWTFYRSATDRSSRYPLLAALSLAGLLLSHNISFMLFVPLLTGYLVYLFIFGAPGILARREVVLRFILAGILGLGLAAFFWLPAFAERDAIRLAGITTGFFDFRRNFISLEELLALPHPLDQAAVNPYFPLSLGTAQMVLVGLVLVNLFICLWVRLGASWLRRSAVGMNVPLCPTDRHIGGHVFFFGVALLVYGFLTLPVSQPLWEAAPLLELAEFPWRMLGPAGLCAAVLGGVWVSLGERWFASPATSRHAGRVALVIGLMLTLAANLFYLFHSQFIVWGTPAPADVIAYERHSKAVGTTSTGEFLPRWVERLPLPDVLAPAPAGELAPRVEPLSLPIGAKTRTLQVTAHQILIHVHSPTPFTATFRLLYWPGWQVTIRQQPDAAWQPVAKVGVTWPDGLLEAPLPAGDYEVLLHLEETPLRRFSTGISFLAVAACLGLVLWTRLRPATQSHLPAATSPNALYPLSEALLLAFGLLILVLVTRPLEGWLRVQSPPGAVLGVEYPRRATFAEQVRLLGYDLPSCSQWWTQIRCIKPVDRTLPEILAYPGDTLSAVLYWQALRPLEHDYSVFLQLNGLDQRTYAGTDELHPDDIPSSTWPPTLYVRNPLRLTLPMDAPPVRYTLQTGLYLRSSGERLRAVECACSEFSLAYVWLLPAIPVNERDIPHRLDYRLGDAIQLLGYRLQRAPGRLTLYWRATEYQSASYTVFIHVYDAQAHMIAQADALPLGGLYPTDAWLPGQIIVDTHTFALPPQAHTLRVGLYELSSMRRLSVTAPDGQLATDDAIEIPVSDAEH